MSRIALFLLCLMPISFVHSADAPATALFAGGCFWCMESDYQGREGVLDVISGFTGGELENPTYKGDHSGHHEAIQVTYDPAKITYQELLNLFWVSIDPLDDSGQFCDKGDSYRSALFVANEEERKLAEASLEKVKARFAGQTVHTPIKNAGRFWPVEDYHQDYYLKNPALQILSLALWARPAFATVVGRCRRHEIGRARALVCRHRSTIGPRGH